MQFHSLADNLSTEVVCTQNRGQRAVSQAWDGGLCGKNLLRAPNSSNKKLAFPCQTAPYSGVCLAAICFLICWRF